MFIPSYQIHNILKDFTLQLKKRRQRQTGDSHSPDSPAPAVGPDHLRQASVLTKVADNIMDRIANLGREAQDSLSAVSDRPPPMAGIDNKAVPAGFDYHLMVRKEGKVKKRLVVEDSRNLVERFQHLTTMAEDARHD